MKNTNLIAKRKERGLTQIQLAIAAGISYRQYQNLEANKHCPTLSTAFAIARVLKCDLKEIFTQ